MKKNIRQIFLVSIVVAAMFIVSGCDLFIKTNNGTTDLNWYMGLTDEEGDGKVYTSEFGDVAAVMLEEGYSEKYAIVKDEDAYVNIDIIKENVDDRFYWDKNENMVLFTNANTVYKTKVGESDIEGDKTEKTDYTISLVENDNCYLNMKFVAKFVDMDFQIVNKGDKVPARVCLRYKNDEKVIMHTTKKIEMRTKGNYQNLIVKVMEKGAETILLEKGENWDKVCTKDGYVGYIPTKYLEEKETVKTEYKTDKAEYTHVLMDKKVSLVWNQIYNQTANGNFDELTQNMKGVNVISPTWFSIDDKKGNLSSLADLEYVEKAHEKGLQVWALVNDFKDKKLTKKVLGATTTRQRLVKNIMFFVENYELDGVNIDFEFISEEDGDSYLQFLRELSVECRKAKKVLSIDNYVPSEWSEFYDRNQQYLLADYLIIMNYDEHTSGSSEAGSVSSMNFAKEAIENTIKETGEASRIINGMPFYTRIWYMIPQTGDETADDTKGILVEDSANGNYFLSSEAVGMNTAKNAYKEAGAKPVFDENTGQNYVTYPLVLGDAMIWLEDKTSVKARLELIEKYELGGAAYWALGQESDDIWGVISKYFK